MKKSLFFIGLISLAHLLFGQQWYKSNVPYYRNVNSVTILKPDVIIAAGGNAYNDSIQALFRSDDGGISWNEDPTDSISSWIKSIAFIDTLRGYGVGYNGKMVYTTNGGHNWTKGSSPVNRHLNKVIYLNANTLIVVGGEPDPANSLQTVMKSTDGGNSWNVLYDQPGQWLRSTYFRDTLFGYAVGDSGVFLHTANGGNTWTPVVSPVNRDWNDIAFINADTGYVVGGNDTSATVIKTIDGGANWAVLFDQPGARLRSISFLNQDKGKIVGDFSQLLSSIDGGQSWLPDTIANTLSQNFTSVYFYSDTLGVIGAFGGSEYIYTKSHLANAYTSGVYYTDTTSAQLVGLINTHGYPAQYYFYYTPDSTFSAYFTSNAGGIKNNSFTQVSQNIYGLDPHTRYYYSLVAYTLAGTVNADTLSFLIGNTHQLFSTTGSLTINDSTVQLQGMVKGFTFPMNVSFEYGTTTFFGDSIAANPSLITDTLLHNVTGGLTHLQPFTLYYFRLKGVYNNFTIYGNTFSFYTGTVYSNLQTLPAQNITDTSALFNGIITGSNLPATLNFEYSIDAPLFDLSVPANPYSVNDTLPHHLSASVNPLQPFHNYYYRIKAQTSLGVFYSNTTVFFTGNALAMQILPATETGTTSATLSGYVNSDTLQTSVWFQYGLNNAFSDSIAASPFGVIGNQMNQVTAQLSGLVPDQQYVFRLMAQNVQGTFYSPALSFYTSPNEIPNWDFEFWNHFNIHFPSYWYIYGSASIVTSYDQSKAVLITGTPEFHGGAVLQGFPQGANQILFGYPFTARPDSLIFYANYNIQPNDTAFAFVSFKKNGQGICAKFYPITGTTNNSFVRMSLPISYTSGVSPDSAGIGFTSTNVFGNINGASWMMLDNISFHGTAQNIPNPGFEDWDSIEYDLPERWIHKNDAPANICRVSPVSKTTDAYLGRYAVRLENIFSAYSNPEGSVYAVSLNLQNGLIPGFSISNRYKTLYGYTKFFPQNNDTGYIRISVFKNSQTIGWGALTMDTAISSYSLFSVPIAYIDTVSIPDSAVIFISACNLQPQGSSVLYVDDLSFDGFYPFDSTATAIPVITPDNAGDAQVRIYPNPANDVLFIKYTGNENGEAEVEIFNMVGQSVTGIERLWLNNSAAEQINVRNLPAGTYLVTVHMNGTRSNILLVK